MAKMTKGNKDKKREHRIDMEVIVDAYGPEEQAMGWYYYLDEKLTFPFTARCISERLISPLRVGEKVEVTGMATEDDCMHEMFVIINWMERSLGIPLIQLQAVKPDKETKEAIEDWHYWVEQGHVLC